MTENDPRPYDPARRDDDETRRLAATHTHRYADHPAYAQPQQASRSTRPGNGVIAAILAAALLVGGVAGVVGAAGFTLVDHVVGGSDSSSSPVTSSAVVNRKAGPVAPNSAEGVAQRVLPSVVKINVSGAQGAGSGSGIIISSDGEILTNNHVVALAGQGGDLSVNFNDGSAKRATVLGTDPLTDLAVIKVRGVSGLSPANIGNSDRVQVGENVVAIGSPFGLEATVTSGIVSSLNRPVDVGTSQGTETIYPAIQTDAAINPGNSGGPLVDMAGRVVGINSSIRTGDSGSGGSIGLGFAIPIDEVLPIINQIRGGQTPTHARLGVTVSGVGTTSLQQGARIRSVDPNGVAQSAGLKAGDVITKVDDLVIDDSDSLVATVRGHRPGDSVQITYVRGGTTKTVTVKLGSDESSRSS
jgi:putative serine protease PepD